MDSESRTPQVYAAIGRVVSAMAKQGIAKGRRNQQQGYQFRGIDDVLNALSPALSSAGLVMLPRVMSRSVVERASKSGGSLFSVVLDVEFDLVATADGSRHTVRVSGEAMDSADKATNKAMSAAYKYAAIMAFCVPVVGLDDADETTPEPVGGVTRDDILRAAKARWPDASDKELATAIRQMSNGVTFDAMSEMERVNLLGKLGEVPNV
jgi:CBS domain-containing protein